MSGKVLDSLGKLLGFATNVTDPKQYSIKEEKRYKYRLEAAMKFIHVTFKTAEFVDIDDEEMKKLQIHYSKRVFDEG